MSGLGQRLGSLLAKRRQWGRDVRGNMQIVEVMVVGLMVVGAVVAVSTMDVPVSRTEGFKETNEGLVKDSLASMARHPSSRAEGALFGSLLEEYVMEAVSGNPRPLMDYLNKTLPAGANYNVLLDNGYGPPRTLVDSGHPPRESVAGSIQFVPKLAYTFMISDFAQYQGDFQMNVHALPVSNGVLLHDEGDSVEVAVTFHDQAEPESPVTVRSYASTALRQNDPNARSWPSVAMYVDVPEKNHFVDASGLSPYAVNVPLLGEELLTNDYNISFDLALEETAGIEVPKNAQIRFQFPRLWDLQDGQRAYVESHPDRGNAKFWKDFEYESDWKSGLIVKARLKEPFAGEKIWFNMTADFMALIDSAHPHFGTLSITMSDGVQGMTNLVIKQPGANMAGSLRREVYPSLSKPLISGDTTTWGSVFVNKGQSGDVVVVESVEVRQPQGKPIFNNLQPIDSWGTGTWTEEGPGHWKFTPTNAAQGTVVNGQAAWLSFNVQGGYTTNNNYRNDDYLNVTSRFNPENNTAGTNDLGEWEFTQRAFEMWEEWVHRIPIAPSDGDDTIQGITPGYPDQLGKQYWVTGGTAYRKALLPGNFSYGMTAASASSGYFGDYQGSHVFSTLDVVDSTSNPARDFPLGGKVRIKNDFSAVFGELSTIDGLAPVSVTNLRIDTHVYTPEQAWKGVPTRSFSENAGVLAVLEDIRFLAGGYVADDDTHILVAVDSGGVAYGLDTTDGAKFWVHDTGRGTASVSTVDLDGDGTDEVLIGHVDGTVNALDIRPNPALASGRLLWTRDFANPNILVPPAFGGYDVIDMVQIATDHATRPELAVTASADLNDALVYGVDVDFDGTAWSTSVHSQFRATDKSRGPDLRIQDLEPVWIEVPRSGDPSHVAAASDNATVVLLDATDLSVVTWVTDMYERPYRLHAADLDFDEADDLVVNTYDDTLGGTTGKGVLVISGRTGNWGSNARPSGSTNALDPFDVVATGDGGVFATSGSMYVMQDTSALYEVGLAWPNLNGAAGPFDLGTIANKDWNGLDATPDGNVFVIETDGEIRGTTNQRAVDGGYAWQRVTPLTMAASGGSYIDLHMAKDWATGGRIHGLDANGAIYAMDDLTAWVPLTAVCDGGGVPHAGVACGPDTDVERWRVQEDAQGNAVAIFALVNDGETTPATAGVYRYDVAAGTWTTVQTWSGHDIADLHIAPNGTYHAAGSVIAGGAAWLERKAPAGSWTSQTIMSTSGKLTSVLVNAAGDAYVASDEGAVWRSSTENTWTRVPIGDMPAHQTSLVETADGQVWALGRDFAAAPLYVHERSSWIYFPTVHDEIAPGELITHFEIKATEGHTGSDPATGSERTLTEVTWWYKTASVTEWTPVPLSDLPRTPLVAQQRYNVTVNCLDSDLCEDLQLRAHLRSRVLSDGLEPMRRDGGASPMIRDVKVTFYNALFAGPSETILPAAGVPLAGSTAVYTAAHQGFVSPLESHRAWTYVGAPNAVSPNTGNNRQVALSSHSLTTGVAGADVMVTESASPGSVGLLLDGFTGGIKRPASGTTTWVTTGTDETERVLLLDMDMDGYQEVVGFGNYDGEAGAVRVWDVMDNALSTSDGDGGTDVHAFVSLGSWNGLHHVAAATTQQANTVKLITALSGDTSGGDPTLLWTSDPTVAQGKATFVYDIGLGDMYGTGIVISELVFTIDDGGSQVTQTARLLDWFNITPPNQGVPNPPVYMVEIVSWFNEV